MKFGAAARALGVVLLTGVLLEGAAAAARADVVPANCTVLAAGDLGRPVHGTFTDAADAGCFELPLPAQTVVAAIQPSTGAGTQADLTLEDATGAVVCGSAVFNNNTCALRGTAPFRVVTSPFGGLGDYQFEVLPVAANADCAAQVPDGAVGSDTGVNATLSADTVTACYTIPARGHSTRELFTMARTAGSGNAQVMVFRQTGGIACAALSASHPTAAVVFTCVFQPDQAYTVAVWADAAPATFRLALRDITAGSLTCQPLTVTDIGGPATAGTITTASDVRCYDLDVPAGVGDLVNIRSAGSKARMTWLTPGSGYYCQASWYACTTDSGPTDRRYRVVVWAAAADPLPYRLDVWKITTGGVVSPSCERLPSVAYGSDTFNVALSDQQTARCVVAPVGSDDRYQLSATGVDPAAAQPNGYVFAALGANTMSFALPCPTNCSPNALIGYGQSTDGLFLFTPGDQFGDVSYRARINCLTEPCGGQPYAITQISPDTVSTGAAYTFTVTGAGFDAADTAQLTQAGSAPINATVRSVTPDRHTLVVDADLTTAATGPWKVTVTSAKTGQTTGYYVSVNGPALQVTTMPSISGTARVGATVTAIPGRWTPAATSYTYQWLANGTPISGATAPTYTIPASLLARTLTIAVAVTAHRDYRADGTATSAAIAVAAGSAGPKATKPPRITGTAAAGKTVSVSAGTWWPAATSYSYQWYLNGKAINGATRTSLHLTSSMRGRKLTVIITAYQTSYPDEHATTASINVR
ncbi:hypothetical protein [Actinoplanes subtropicus]|uniref:hypothetical protein n=1 Tax=Actinoplanes subtropicus TaxID=543632 RepID=UPI0004C2F79C|nr:hypothetical protein [Actinoplanes subtropicus]